MPAQGSTGERRYVILTQNMVRSSAARYVFLPGLGATGAMYDPLIHHINTRRKQPIVAEHVEYIAPERRESLRQFAARLFDDYSRPTNNRKSFISEPDVLVGCSFGGMIAQEWIAQGLLQPKRLVLISTAFCGADLSNVAGKLARAADLVPAFAYRPMRNTVARLFPFFRPSPWAKGLAQMSRELPPPLIFRAAKMIRQWRRGLDENELRDAIAGGFTKDTLFMMGLRDPVISARRVRKRREPDVIFERGDHLIAVARPAEIARKMA